jgi:hypothetical protein
VLWEDSFKSGKAKAPPSLTSFILWVLFFPFSFFHSRRCCELWSISFSLDCVLVRSGIRILPLINHNFF